MKRDSFKDSLTGLDNRTSYKNKTIEIDSNDKHYTYAILDLFRLKYVNDNFGHAIGDEYLIKTAEILKRYFPKHHIVKDENGTVHKIDAGNCVYRIGGDEFVIISSVDDLATMEIKIEFAAEEVKSLKISTKKPIILGLNYGISERSLGESSKELYLGSDSKLSDNKREMYVTLGIDRRK